MSKLPTIYELRKAGHRIKVSHFRYTGNRVFPTSKLIGEEKFSETNPLLYKLERVTKIDKKERKFPYISAKGGRTEIEFTPKGETVNEVRQANCNPKDPFNRKLGVRICLGRLRADGVI